MNNKHYKICLVTKKKRKVEVEMSFPFYITSNQWAATGSVPLTRASNAGEIGASEPSLSLEKSDQGVMTSAFECTIGTPTEDISLYCNRKKLKKGIGILTFPIGAGDSGGGRTLIEQCRRREVEIRLGQR